MNGPDHQADPDLPELARAHHLPRRGRHPSLQEPPSAALRRGPQGPAASRLSRSSPPASFGGTHTQGAGAGPSRLE